MLLGNEVFGSCLSLAQCAFVRSKSLPDADRSFHGLVLSHGPVQLRQAIKGGLEISAGPAAVLLVESTLESLEGTGHGVVVVQLVVFGLSLVGLKLGGALTGVRGNTLELRHLLLVLSQISGFIVLNLRNQTEHSFVFCFHSCDVNARKLLRVRIPVDRCCVTYSSGTTLQHEWQVGGVNYWEWSICAKKLS